MSLFYPRHSGSDVQTHLARDIVRTQEEDCLISEEILRQAESLGIDALSEWCRLFTIAESHGLAGNIQLTPQLRDLLQIDRDQRRVDPGSGMPQGEVR
jgi:hypothetical protein